ncbi:MFS transporter [Streptomyces azureus]|uniref:Major facilitator superfamily MFS_1 n=1 Tax=Streptomyces azureus TaxID=146537 RepID=A0A0K8PK94_STRAJ|nr:MFS transporter [Streptomyces azureus]GAP48296.1 major facilitator superfamily MFS_1 [Streptomyces azureus]
MKLSLPHAVRASPYRPVVAHPVLRRLLPGYTVSSLGDGMAVVAVSWLAVELAPADDRGMWVAFAAAAYTLPGAAGAVLLNRLLRGLRPARLATWDALLRAGALGAIPLAQTIGVLSIWLYVALLGASSVLHSWGQAGTYTLIARQLPEGHHLAGNAVLSTIGSVSTVTGPLLAAPLVIWGGAASVLAVVAATFAVLAATLRLGMPPDADTTAPDEADQASRTSGFGVIRHDRGLAGLLLLSAGFFLLFGPVYVALPLHVADDLHAPVGVLATFYSLFGAGAVAGAVLTGYLRRLPLGPAAAGIVAVSGAALLPLGLGAPTAAALAGFALVGLLWPPYSAMSTTLFQRSTTPALLPQVLTVVSAARTLAVPLGTVLGGPAVAALGPTRTLLVSAVGILALGLAAVAALPRRARPADRDRPPAAPAPKPPTASHS